MYEEIRIYVACLAAYNNGELHGAWIDATQDLDDVNIRLTEIIGLLRKSTLSIWR